MKPSKKPILLSLCLLGGVLAAIFLRFFFQNLQEKTLAYDQCIKKFVAHAGGGLGDLTYTNSIEALNHNYQLGFRYLEIDFDWTRDQHLVAFHIQEGYFEKYFGKQERTPSLKEFQEMKMNFNLTQVTLENLFEWMKNHKEVIIITDIKRDNIKALQYILLRDPEKGKRFIPQIFGFSEYQQVKDLGFNQIILALYQFPNISSQEFLDFISNNPLFGITIPQDLVYKVPILQALKPYDVLSYVHTINNRTVQKKLIQMGADGIYTDFIPPDPCKKLFFSF